MKKLCLALLSIILLASTVSARPLRFVTKYTPSKYDLYQDGAIGNGQVEWKLQVEKTPDIVTSYTAWARWKDYRVAQFEKMAPIERGNTYYFAEATAGASDSNDCSFLFPCATRSKCLTLITTNNGNTRCRFKESGIWYDDTNIVITQDNVTIDCYANTPLLEANCTNPTKKPLFDAFTLQYEASGWTLAAGNRYTRTEASDVAYVLDTVDRYGVTRGLPLIRADSAANCELTSNSFFHDGVTTLHINLGGTNPNTLFLAAVVSQNNNGFEIQSTGVRIENLRAEGFGMHRTEVATQDQPFTVRNGGSERAYFKGLIGYYSNTHVIALNNATGGGWMCKNCIAGLGQVDPGSDAMSNFNSYAANGGHETWIIDSEARGGALPELNLWPYATEKTAGTGLLAHTGGAAGGVGVVFNLDATVFAGTRINAVTDWNNPFIATLDDFSTFKNFSVKSTLDAYPSAHMWSKTDRSAYTIYYGMEWNGRSTNAITTAGAWRNDDMNLGEYFFNCRWIADMTDYGNSVGGFYNGNPPATAVGTIVNSDIIFKNWTATSGTIRYGSDFDNRANVTAPGTGNAPPNMRVFSSIVSVDTSTWTGAGLGAIYATLAFDNDADTLKNLAISGFKPLAANVSSGFDNVANRVDLASAYNTPGTSVAALINAGDTTFGLSHDFNGKLRIGIPDIGSTEY